MLRFYSPLGLALRLGVILLCIMANGARSHAAESSSPAPGSISMDPYPYTLETGLMCDTAADLKISLDALAGDKAPPADIQCLILPEGFDVPATATPVEIYKNTGIYGMITRYDAPNMPEGFGIMALPMPAGGTPAPSPDDQHI